MNKVRPQGFVGVFGLLLATPLLLAWLAAQMLSILDRGPYAEVSLSPSRPLWGVLLWGPLLETALLLLSSATVSRMLARRGPGSADNAVTCAGIIGLSFGASHLLQNGTAALVSMPMAILLSAGAARTVQSFCILSIVRHGLALFAIHVLYNASLIGFSSAMS